jgi:transcriptional regulator with XRE-family HTH domain
MNPDLLRQYGEAVYGDRWQAQLAREMGVASRTVARWASGEIEITEARARDIRTLAERRFQALKALLW